MEYETEAAVAVAVAPAPGMLRRAFPYARLLAQLALATALLGGMVWRVDVVAVRDELEQATLWWLPLAFVANLASDWFRAIRWQQFFQPMKRLSVPFLFAVALLGVASNLALPFRAGEIIRVQVLRKRTGLRVSSIVATLLSEKLMDVVAFSSFVVLGLVLYKEAHFLWPLAVAYGGVLVCGLVGARWLAVRAEGEPGPMKPPTGRLTTWIAGEMHSFGKGLQAFRRPRAMFHVVWASYAAWLCEAVLYYACGRALGLDLSLAVYLLVVVAATIAVSVPVTQAGLGVFEIAIAGLLIAFGVDEAQAAAFAIFSHLMLALPYFMTGPAAAFALRLGIADILFLRSGRGDPGEDLVRRGAEPTLSPP
jgi:uncharacterized membrane protein YbhN (UPF0104 family)